MSYWAETCKTLYVVFFFGCFLGLLRPQLFFAQSRIRCVGTFFLLFSFFLINSAVFSGSNYQVHLPAEKAQEVLKTIEEKSISSPQGETSQTIIPELNVKNLPIWWSVLKVFLIFCIPCAFLGFCFPAYFFCTAPGCLDTSLT